MATEREQLVDAIVNRLAVAGAPQGTWLIDITEVRQGLRQAWEHADDLLGRLQTALLEQHQRNGAFSGHE